MKFKLTHDEFMALHDMFQQVCHKYQAQDFWDKLLHVISTVIFMKLYKMAIIRKASYNLKLSECEALGFYLLTHDHKQNDASFLGNLLNSINMIIHQKFTI